MNLADDDLDALLRFAEENIHRVSPQAAPQPIESAARANGHERLDTQIPVSEAEPAPAPEANGYDAEPPAPNGPEDYGLPVEGAVEREPDETPNDRTKSTRKSVEPATLVTPVDWQGQESKPVQWIWHRRVVRGDVTSLHADGGVGKTELALMLSQSCARDAQDCLGAVVESGPVLFLSAEEPKDVIHSRLERQGKRQGFILADCSRLHFWFPPDLKDCTLATSSGKNRKMVATELFSSICEAAQRLRPVLIVLDNTAATFVGDLVDRVNARSWVNLWRALAIEVDAGVLLLDHPSMNGMNSGSGRAGSVDWRNAVRVALHMRFSDDPTEAARGTTKFEVSKCNLGPRGEAIKLEWVDGLLCLEGSGSPLQRLARDAQADSKFLELLADRLRLGRDVGDKPGRNYAPAIFAETEGNGGYSKKAFTLAMERLFKANKITLEPVGPPSANKKRIIIVASGAGQ